MRVLARSDCGGRIRTGFSDEEGRVVERAPRALCALLWPPPVLSASGGGGAAKGLAEEASAGTHRCRGRSVPLRCRPRSSSHAAARRAAPPSSRRPACSSAAFAFSSAAAAARWQQS